MSIRVTEDEVDKRMAEIRERRRKGEQIDASTVRNAERGKRYKWVNRRHKDGDRVHHFRDAGYEVVKAPKEGAKGVRTASNRVDETGAYINGDSILMACDRETYVDRLATNKLRAYQNEKAYIEARREDLNRIARNEAGAKSDVAFDDSKQGEERIARRRVSGDDDD